MDAELLKKRVSEMTADELWTLIHDAVNDAIENKSKIKPEKKRSPLEIPTIDVGPWPENLRLITRDEIYEDDER